jgi:hypothetical protein
VRGLPEKVALLPEHRRGRECFLAAQLGIARVLQQCINVVTKLRHRTAFAAAAAATTTTIAIATVGRERRAEGVGRGASLRLLLLVEAAFPCCHCCPVALFRRAPCLPISLGSTLLLLLLLRLLLLLLHRLMMTTVVVMVVVVVLRCSSRHGSWAGGTHKLLEGVEREPRPVCGRGRQRLLRVFVWAVRGHRTMYPRRYVCHVPEKCRQSTIV